MRSSYIQFFFPGGISKLVVKSRAEAGSQKHVELRSEKKKEEEGEEGRRKRRKKKEEEERRKKKEERRREALDLKMPEQLVGKGLL